ncbi:MAG: hypothetical protein H0A76_00410 [Candidatus Thiodubiliella endoseptemdiera]|uniref:Peptidase C80 domain-containing protein n=1 Tax=Candidatus Thiodubiliella endoseptemdiera TaxID=2738886 RepID=A0A853F1I6_9GAMM|nr:hypothetical protein [Candidatus Thiodubiliella endoseptemdiera]
MANVGRNKIVISGRDFLLTGVNDSFTKTLAFVYTVKANDRISAANFNIYNKDIVLSNIKDADGNAVDLDSVTDIVKLSREALSTDFIVGGGNKITQTNGTYQKTSGADWDADVFSSKGFVGDGYVIAKIGALNKNMMLGLSSDNTNSSSIDYALYANGSTGNKFVIYEHGKHSYDTGVTYANGDYMKVVREGAEIQYYHIKAADGPLATGTLIHTSAKTLNADTKLFLDSSFLSVGAKLSDMQIFNGKNSPLSIDVHAPKPVVNAWRVDASDATNGVFTIGNKIKVTLTLDEAVTLAGVGRNKVVIAGKDFLLTGNNGTTTKTLDFTYTVKVNDRINAVDFDIDNKHDIILANIKDTDGNYVDLSSITGSTKLNATKLNTDLSVSSDNKMSKTNDTYEKTANAAWDADVFSSEGFMGDGYVIAKIGTLNKRIMLGLSSDNTNSSYNSIDYALYADGGIGNRFVIYEDGVRQKGTGAVYAVGDYMKVVREGTTVKYYHIKAVDGPLAAGNLLYTSTQASSINTKLFLDSSFYEKGAQLSDMQIFSGAPLALSVDVGAPKPVANAWHVNTADATQGVFTIGNEIKVTLTLDEAVTLANVGSNKIVIAGKDFLLKGANGALTKTLEFSHIVQANEKTNTAFYINDKRDIILTDIKDSSGNNINLDDIVEGVDLSPEIQNIALNSKGLATITTNIDAWHQGDAAANIKRMTDGNTSSHGALDYATHPNNADGKYMLFDFGGINYTNGSFKLYNRKAVAHRINGSTVEFLKEGKVVSRRTISSAGNVVEIIPAAGTAFDQVKLTFSGSAQNFREIKIFGKNSNLSIDSGAPEPLAYNAWHVDASTATNGVFAIGDKIKVTLTLDEAVTLAGVGSNKIVIAGTDFLLTGANGVVTDRLNFTYTVQANDKIDATSFDIDNKGDIVLTDIKDKEGNSIDLSSITGPTKLNATKLNTDLSVSSDNKMSKTNDTYEKTANAAWDADVFSSEGFMGDGYVIAKIGTLNKRIMLGLSSDNTNSSYNSIDYALYADGGIGNKFVIYEDGVRQKGTGTAYAVGDYMKVVREGTTVKYYHIKAVDGPLAAGNLLYTSTQASSINTKLFLDSSFYEKGAQLSDMQIFSGAPLALSVDVGAPKLLLTNPWKVDANNAKNGVFTVGDEIKVTLALDEAVTLANIGSNKIIIAGKDFLLTGANGSSTSTLEFTHTIKRGDGSTSIADFNIHNKNDIILTNIKDIDGNIIDMSSITSSVNLGHIASQSFHVAKNQHLLIDCNAPTPLKSNAWRVNVNDAMNGVFTIDDEIKITLTLDEAVTLANIGSNKIIVAGKDFLLIGANGDITKTLEFSHTVKVGDGRIGAKNFDINNRNDIILDGVKDTDGNVIDLSHITNPVKLSGTLINTDFNIGGGNKITQVGNTYEKTSNNGWNADVSSSKGFVGDGYVIAKIGAIGKRKRMMFGLSDNNTNNSYNSIDYALYADGGIGNRFAIYESGRKKYESNVAYALGDYMKIVKEGATIKYYHIKASDGVLATGTLIYTSDKKVLNANTELFLDSSLHDVGTKLSNVQIFSGNNPTFSMNAKTSTLSTDDASGQSKDILNQTTSGYGRNSSVDSNSNHDSTETSTPDSKTHDKETQDGANGASTKARKEQGKDPSRWFTDKKLNQNFSKGLSFSQTPQVFILTDDSYESLNLGLWLKKENDIVIYYNTKNNKIEYLYGEDNDIETTYVEYKIIANGKTVDTLVEDTINDIYVAIDKKVKIGKKDEVDEGGVEDEIDTASIVAQLKQTIATMRANAGLHKNWLTRRSFEKYNLDFENIFWQREMQAQTPDSTLNSNPNPNSDTSTPKKSRYHSNIIVQNSNDKTVVEAANALFNKHPNNSIIVQFDKDGKLVTLKGDTYTPQATPVLILLIMVVT